MIGVWGEGERLILNTKLVLQRRENDWEFSFSNDVDLCVECPWRIRNAEGLRLTDTDDGVRFGLPKPIDAVATANALLAQSTVVAVPLDTMTSDLSIDFSDRATLKIWTTSSGFESWQMYHDGRTFVGGNGGLR